MARQSSVGRARGWLVSAIFWSWIEKKSSDFPDRFRNEKWNAHAHSVHAHLQQFRVHGVIVCMPYHPSRKVRWPNLICLISMWAHCQQCNDTFTSGILTFWWHRSFSCPNALCTVCAPFLIPHCCSVSADRLVADHIFFLFILWPKASFQIQETLRKWAIPSAAVTATSERRRVQPPLSFKSKKKYAQLAMKVHLYNVLPACRLTAPSLLTTQNVARSKYSSRKNFFCTTKCPNLWKELKVDVFSRSFAVCMHGYRAGRRSPLSAQFSNNTVAIWLRSSARCSATQC